MRTCNITNKSLRHIVHLALLCALSMNLVGCGERSATKSTQVENHKKSDDKLENLTKKAELGDKNAQFELGSMYLKVEKVPSIEMKAAEWIQKAAQQGHVEAQYILGDLFHFGKGVEMDREKSIEWYEKAASQGHAGAQYRMGEILAGNLVANVLFPSRKWDRKRGMAWYAKAAEQGHAEAQSELAAAYRTGDAEAGISASPAEAARWYLEAAKQGNESAQIQIAMMLDDGEGVPKNSAAAVKWYLAAAAQGQLFAQSQLSIKYFNGEGVARDFVRAYAWASLAVTKGSKEAKKNVVTIDKQLTKDQRAIGQSLASNWKSGDNFLPKETSPSTNSQASGSIAKAGTGTGFFVSKNGQLVTNHHVINGCKEVRISGRDSAVAVITADPVNDLALLQFSGAVNAVAIIDSDQGKLRQGDEIVVFGYPLNSVLSSGGNLTPGMVSALTGLNNNTNQLQITAPIQPGSSGSPVMNKKGEIVGVVAMKLSDSKMASATGQVGQNVNFAVNGQTLKSFLDAHKVEYATGGLLSFGKSTADMADDARKWTTVVECWK